jgi:hypothetical protein
MPVEGCDQLVIKDSNVPEPFMPDRAWTNKKYGDLFEF